MIKYGNKSKTKEFTNSCVLFIIFLHHLRATKKAFDIAVETKVGTKDTFVVFGNRGNIN